MSKGYIYILENESMKGIIKIGMTTRDIQTRVNEVSRATGIPTPFICTYHKLVNDCVDLEFKLHNYYRLSRVNEKREFFYLTTEEVKKYIEEITKNENPAEPTEREKIILNIKAHLTGINERIKWLYAEQRKYIRCTREWYTIEDQIKERKRYYDLYNEHLIRVIKNKI